MRVIKAMRAGITSVNTYHPTYSEAPWGGYKQSGIGRELGTYGLAEYQEVKQINIDLTDRPLGVYPLGKQNGKPADHLLKKVTSHSWTRGRSGATRQR